LPPAVGDALSAWRAIKAYPSLCESCGLRFYSRDVWRVSKPTAPPASLLG